MADEKAKIWRKSLQGATRHLFFRDDIKRSDEVGIDE